MRRTKVVRHLHQSFRFAVTNKNSSEPSQICLLPPKIPDHNILMPQIDDHLVE